MPATALIGSRLREERLSAGLRQSDVAARAGVSPAYLNLIEHNRRRVTAPVLERLALALGTDVVSLVEGAGAELAEDLRAAAAVVPGAAAELDRLEEFAGRFPGWAAVAAGLHARAGALERAVEAMNDRMTHDPHLSAALHELLSALTGVRATAQILAETPDLDPGLSARFHANLHADSERLASGAEALVSFLDGGADAREQGIATPQEEVEDWLRDQGWHLATLETDGPEALEPAVAGLASMAARSLGQTHVERAAEDARALPLDRLQAALKAGALDPARLAGDFGTSVIRVLRRVAFLPGSAAGFVSCDASGTLTLRKPMAGFSFPRFGAACPLWPLYEALSRPFAPVRRLVQTPGPIGDVYLAYAFCQSSLPQGFGGPELREAAMLILPLPNGPSSRTTGEPVWQIGSTCRICPREACPARREPSIMREGL